MKKFCEYLREYTIKINDFEMTKVIPLTNGEYESYLNQTNCHICEKKIEDKYTNDKKILQA